MSLLSPLAKRIRATNFWQNVVVPAQRHKSHQHWLKSDRPVPAPHEVKVRNLMAMADLYDVHVLVETGTYHGDTISAVQDRFKKIYSIEIYEPFATRAQQKFADLKNVNVILGDSAAKLPGLLAEISEPILFWLDGHYSGQGTGLGDKETPILAEIEHIHRLRRGYKDVILIDDARCFTGSEGYPDLASFMMHLTTLFGRRPLVANDAIFILPEK